MPLSSSYLACSCCFLCLLLMPTTPAVAVAAAARAVQAGAGLMGCACPRPRSLRSVASRLERRANRSRQHASASAGNPRRPPRSRRSRNEVSASRFACGWRGRLSCRAMQNLARPGRARASASLCRDKPRRDGADDIDYRAHGFILEKRIILDGWTTLVIVRRNGQALRD